MRLPIIWIIILVFIGLIAGWFAADWDEFIERKFGRTYDIENSNDLRDLQRLCFGL